jgi:hypothetical protein
VICGKINVPYDGQRKNVAHKRVGLDIIEIRIMKKHMGQKIINHKMGYAQKQCPLIGLGPAFQLYDIFVT